MNTQTTVEPTTRKVANHSLLDAGGNPVEDYEAAVGIRYQDIESGGTVDFIPKSDRAKSMGWCFGFRTLATNEASAARQKGADGAAQLAAIKARFDLIDPPDGSDGQWVSREREAIVYDPGVAATAATNLVIDGGVKPESERGAVFAKFSQHIAERGIDAMVTVFRSVKGFDDEYRRLKGGKQKKDASDLGSLLT